MIASLLLLAVSAAPSSEPLEVRTTFYPTTFFAERIGGEHVHVACPVPEDADPIFWKPTSEALRDYQTADLVLVNGAEFEQWVGQVSLPLSTTVSTSRPFRDEWLHYEKARTHSHGPEGEHSHAGLDGHTWLDPENARRQAAAIRDALAARRPGAAEDFDAGYEAVASELSSLDRRLRGLGGLPRGDVLLASHPAYNYLARRYDWPVVNLDLDPEAVPTEVQLEEIRSELGGRRARALLWESEPVAAAARRIEAALGVPSLVFSPCEMLSAEEREEGADYLSVMHANVDRLTPAFGNDG